MKANVIVNKLLEADLDSPDANLDRYAAAIDVEQNTKAVVRWEDRYGQRHAVVMPGYTVEQAKAVVREYTGFRRILSARLKRNPE